MASVSRSRPAGRPGFRALAAAAVLALPGAGAAVGGRPLDTPAVPGAQPLSVAARGIAYRLVAGPFDNPAPEPRLVFTHTLDAGSEARWVRVVFGSASLPAGGYVRLTSLLDGYAQALTADVLRQWGNASAFFNGSRLRLELVAGPRSQGTALAVEQLAVNAPGEPAEALDVCTEVDDRRPSDFAPVARLLAGDPRHPDQMSGCSGFIIDTPAGPDKCHLSAGHCFVPGVHAWQRTTIVQFDVPPSLPNCFMVHPPPAKQFAVRSFEAVNDGVGHDWAVFTCYPNATTGLTTFEEQGAAMSMASVLPPVGTDLRVTGYGIDGGGREPTTECECDPGAGTGTANQTQQTAIGPLTGVTEDTLDYRVSTCTGNSGSPVVVVGTGLVVAIHTAGGCPAASNQGTAITQPRLESAIRSCSPPPAGLGGAAAGGSTDSRER